MHPSTTLFRRDFTLVVIGQIISLFGNAILRFALPLYLLRTTGSPTLFGVVTACSFAPMVVLSLIGGIVADRVNKRNIMVILDACTAVLVAGFTLILNVTSTVPLFILTLMLLYGISGTYQPAVQASIPLLVAPERLVAANAIINQVNTLSGLLGPVLGGIFYSLWGITPILWLSVICFAFSAVMECFIHIPHTRRTNTTGIFVTVAGDLRESCRFVRHERPLFFAIMALVALFNLILSACLIVGTPVLITQTLALSDTLYGFTQGALALGGLCGGILAALWASRLRIQQAHLLLLICACSVCGMGLALTCTASPLLAYGIITVMSFFAMAASTLFMVQIYTLVQTQTPPHLIGKVMAALIAIAMCGQPLGQALYGLLFEALANQPWMVLFGAAITATAIALISRSIFHRLNAAE